MAERTCLGCRKVLDKADLMRYVMAPDGSILPDYRGKLPGRGTYTCLSLECLRQAVKTRQFDRAFKGANQPASLALLEAAVQDALLAKVEALIGMGRKSGVVITGTQEVELALRQSPPPALLLLAGDLSDAIAQRLRALAEKRNIQMWQGLNKDRLGELVGKGLRSAVAVRQGHLAESLTRELRRYQRVSGEN